MNLITEGLAEPKKFRVSFCEKPHQIIQRITVDAKSFADARKQGKEWLSYGSPGGTMKIAYIHQKVGEDWLSRDEIEYRRQHKL
ncbi:MAG: hypothetical protein EOP83_05410 [Verrucomicrobiaceae bacterium]|nr:MAG: hypothetical protein EOP83_05410 [Verrucomicrobiaceae bacterium]